MFFSRCFLFLLFVMTTAITTMAQTDPATILPWNGIDAVERYDTPSFTPLSLSGPAAATRIQGSESMTPISPMVDITVPFSFIFFHQVYPIGTHLRIGINGVIAVAPQGTQTFSASPYHLNSAAYSSYSIDMHHNLLAPFWGDLTAVGVPNGGIWTYVDNTADPHVLTIEWHVKPMYGSGGEGVFQVRLVRANGTSGDYCYIEYTYDPNHPISLPQPGAFVGMKKDGQSIGDPGATTGSGLDDSKLLIYTRENYPGFPNVAFTRLPTRNQPSIGGYTPDWFPGYSSSGSPQGPNPSPLFHYGFPDKSYRSKPIESDVIALSGSLRPFSAPVDSIPDTAFIRPGTNHWLRMKSYNASLTPLSNIPVKAIIAYNGAPVTTLFEMIPLLGSGDSVITVFTGPLDSTITNTPGTYDVSVIANYPGDGDHGNDTARLRFYVRDTRDISPYSIATPTLSTIPIRSYNAVGTPIPITGQFINSGLQTEHDVMVGWRIVTASGAFVAQRTDTLHGNWDTMQVREMVFQPWTPSAPGLYRLILFSALPGDMIHQNDSLDVPIIDLVAPGWPTNFAAIPTYYLGVLPAIDLGVTASPASPDLPFAGQLYSGQVPVRILVSNDGSINMTNASLHVVIRDAANAVVYDQTNIVPFVAGGHGVTMEYFPDFNPVTTGTYCVEATISGNGDANPSNDMATWCFQVGGSDAGPTPSESENAVSISVTPNPVGTAALVEYHIPNGKEGGIDLYDMYGRRVTVIAEQGLRGSGSIVLHADALTSGTYTVQMVLSDGTRTTRMLTVVH